MSKLSRLLNELCPEGVEYKTLGEIASISRGGNFQKKHYVLNGVPCIHYGQIYTKYNLFVNETDSYIDHEVAKKQKFAEPGDIIMAVTSENVEDVCKSIAWLGNDRIAVSGHTAIIHHNQNPKYLVYYFSSQMFQDQKRKIAHGTKVIEVSPAKLNEVKVAVPPLEIQREIVHILDSFTLLTAELTEKLTAELTARRKQYEFYRDKLLTIKDDIPIKKIGEICKVVSGGTPSRKNAEYWENGSIKWLGSTVCQNKKTIDKVTDYITNEGLVNSSAKIMREGTTLVALVGATIGKVAFLPYDAAINQNIAGIFPKDRNILNPSYLYYACTMLYPKFLKLTKGSKLAMANLSFIRELEISVPHIEVQNRIVYVLEHFEDICSDLNIGLPAEIEARKKQYEYYRDVLLTFAETGKTILTDRQTDRQSIIKLLQYVYGYVYVDLDSVLVSLNTGLNPRNFFKLNTEDANNYYITIREIQDGKIVVSEKTDKINDEALRLCNNRSNIESGDVLFSGTGTIGETAVVGELPFGWNIKEGVYSLKPDKAILDSKYLRYLLMTGNIKNLYMKKVVGGTVKSIPMKELRKLVIPLPSLEEQQHIAKVIEQFDAICSDLQSGLPAEIEKRLKQYEYYRDKLLSFKEL